jgi:hydrogenase nickel incorporation protein HypA/HybF
MHELSLASDVISLVAEEARKNGVEAIHELSIELGELCGVDAESFRFSLDLLRKGTLLDTSSVRIIGTEGKARCSACGELFGLHDLLSSCPSCGGPPGEILAGREFRLISMIAG